VAKALDAEKARAVSDLAARVEEQLGLPQDIEWAIGGGSVWLLQARPITALPSDAPELIPIPTECPGYWTTDRFHWPTPASPFGRVMGEELRKALPAAFAEFGILLDRAEHADIGGWLYAQVTPVGAPPAGRSGGRGRQGTPPRWLLALLMRLHPAIRRRTRAARRAIESDLPFALIRRWHEESRRAYQEDAERALALDLGSMSDEAGARSTTASNAGRPEPPAWARHFVVMFGRAEARRGAARGIPRGRSRCSGLSTVTTEPARQLAPGRSGAVQARSQAPIGERR
jgi:pyruvate,water dikinase